MANAFSVLSGVLNFVCTEKQRDVIRVSLAAGSDVYKGQGLLCVCLVSAVRVWVLARG